MEEIFEIKDVDLYYGPKQVLKKVNLNLYKNKVTAFIGPSGCGKSTLLRCLNRMNDLIEGCKIEGQIKYRNENINDINPVMLRTKVGMVFQNPNPFPMSIFDNVAYGPRCSGLKAKDKLCIARAIAMSPEIILMDEPTSALDPIATLKIEELIDSLKKDFTIIIVTHNMQQATRISDYTAFFLMGEVIEYADTTTLFTNPKEKKTEDYITGRFG